MSEGIVVAHWNGWKGNSRENVRAALTRFLAEDPDVIYCQEASRFHGILAEFAEAHGYLLIQEKPRPERRGRPVPEHGSNAALVRPKVHRSHKIIRLRQRWMVFKHRRWHEPRRPIRVVLDTGDTAWRLTLGHGPTAGNARAVAEYSRAAVGWLRFDRRRNMAAVLIGDQNMGRKTLGRVFGRLRPIIRSHKVDAEVVVGATVVQSKTLGRYGSDHRARVIRLRK